MTNKTKRQNGSITVYGANGVPQMVLDCPSWDGLRHRVYIQGAIIGANILRCHAMAEIKKGGDLIKGVVKSSVQGWTFERI